MSYKTGKTEMKRFINSQIVKSFNKKVRLLQALDESFTKDKCCEEALKDWIKKTKVDVKNGED